MTSEQRQKKIEHLKNLLSGKNKPGELLNYGVWIWTESDDQKFNVCDMSSHKDLKVAVEDFSAFAKSFGGHHVIISNYSQAEIEQIRNQNCLQGE